MIVRTLTSCSHCTGFKHQQLVFSKVLRLFVWIACIININEKAVNDPARNTRQTIDFPSLLRSTSNVRLCSRISFQVGRLLVVEQWLCPSIQPCLHSTTVIFSTNATDKCETYPIIRTQPDGTLRPDSKPMEP